MAKKLLTVLLCGALMCSIFACGSSDTTDSTASNDQSSAAEESADSSSESTDSSSAADSSNAVSDSDILSFKIQIDGTDYSFPMSYTDLKKSLEADGWSADEFGFKSLDVNTEGTISFSRGEEGRLTFKLYNTTDAAINPEDGTVVGTAALESDLLDSSVVMLPGGLEFNSDLTTDVLKSTYGEPNEGSTDTIVVYYADANSNNQVMFDFLENPDDGSTIVDLDIRNYPE